MPRQDKDAGANDGANAKREQDFKRKRPVQLCFAWAALRPRLSIASGLKHCYRACAPTYSPFPKVSYCRRTAVGHAS